MPNEFNAADKQSFARYYPKRLQAEVLFDAVVKLTDSPTAFPGLPNDKFAPNRAIMLPDESFQSYFLDVTGRPQRISACECERVNEASLAMTLHLLNSQEVQDKIARAGGRADQLAKDPRPDAEKVDRTLRAGDRREAVAGEARPRARTHREAREGEDQEDRLREHHLGADPNTKGFLVQPVSMASGRVYPGRLGASYEDGRDKPGRSP